MKAEEIVFEIYCLECGKLMRFRAEDRLKKFCNNTCNRMYKYNNKASFRKKVLSSQKKYNDKHKSKLKINQINWRENNRKRYNEYHNKYYHNNVKNAGEEK